NDQETEEAIPMADVTLLKSDDSSYIDAAYTDDSGAFEVKTSKKKEAFYLQINAFGYHSKITTLVTTENALRIKLSKDSEFDLDEVKITTLRKGVRLDGDKIIFDTDLLGISASA